MATVNPFEVQEIFHGFFVQQCILVVVFTVVVYDICITMDREVKYFWNRRWYNVTHILYFTNRYVGTLGILSRFLDLSRSATTELCKKFWVFGVHFPHNALCLSIGSCGRWLGTVGDIVIGVIIDYILVLRVLALWHNNKVLSIILYLIVVGEFFAKLAILIVRNLLLGVQAFIVSEGITICGSFEGQEARAITFQLVDWIINAAVGCTLIILALYKAVDHWKSSDSKGVNLVNVLIKDQLFYYLMLLFCSAINIYNAIVVPADTSTISYISDSLGSTGFLCLMGSRMFMNLKEAGGSHVHEGTSHDANPETTGTVSEPQFAAPAAATSLDDDDFIVM